MAAEPLPQLYDEDEAAQYLGVSLVSLRRYRTRGEIEYTALSSRKIKYTSKQLKDFIEGSARRDT